MTKERTRSILATVLCIIITVAMMFTFISCNNEPGGEGDKTTDLKNKNLDPVTEFTKLNAGETIYILPTEASSIAKPTKKLQTDDLILATSIQGLIARDKAQIYIGSEDDEWVTFLKEEYGLNFEVLDTLEKFMEQFKDTLPNKTYVKFTYETKTVSTAINQATTIASATGSILVPADAGDILEEFVKGYGFEMKEDLTNNAYSEAELFEKYKSELSSSVIGVLDPQMKNSYDIRDYILASKAGVYILADYSAKDKMNDLYQTFNPLTIAIGNAQYQSSVDSKVMGTAPNQWSQEASSMGIIPVLSGSAANLSLFASLAKDNIGTQKETKDNSKDGEVHYVSVIANFGNDLSYWSDAFTSSKKLGDDKRGEYPIGYTMTPSVYELMPQALKHAYKNMTDNELFIAGPSGFGLANLEALKTHNDGKTLDKYLERTNDILGKSDLGYISVYGSMQKPEMIDKLAALSNVKGGFILGESFTTPTGGIYFSNDKTFIASREILRGTNYRTNEQIANDTAEKLVTRLSNYGKDKSKAEGYTLLQVDDTSSANSFSKIISNIFDKAGEDICFVTPDQLLKLINENVSKEESKEQTVGSINKAPKAEPVTVEVEAGGELKVDLSEYVLDENAEDTLSYNVTRPSNGAVSKVSKTKGTFTYKPDADFKGTDTFEYTVKDGTETVKQTITITVN